MNFKFNLLISMLLIFASQFGNAKILVVKIRGAEDVANLVIQRNGNNVEFLESSTEEFANGNTFVRFHSTFAGDEVIIAAPNEVSSDKFMELLIKVRTAFDGFAAKITVSTESTNGAITVFNERTKKVILSPKETQKLLSVAGLQELDGKILKTPSLHKKPFPQVKRVYVVKTGTNDKFAESIGKNLGVPAISSFEVQHVGDGREAGLAILVTSTVPPQNENFLNSLHELSLIAKNGDATVYVSPYLPYARTDKRDQSGVTITGRLVADLIESSGAKAIAFVRAHAPQSEGFFSIPAIQTMGRQTVVNYLNNLGVEQIISPDAGFQKDATLYADELKIPVGVVNKQRDPITGKTKLHDMSGPSVEGKIVAIIDDETASGKTLHQVAEMMKGFGAKKVFAVVTHLAGDATHAITSPFIDEMIVTDTIPVSVENKNLKIISVADELSSDLSKRLSLPEGSCKSAAQ